jgi:hypothetical protein
VSGYADLRPTAHLDLLARELAPDPAEARLDPALLAVAADGQPLQPVELTRRGAADLVVARTAGEGGDDDEERYLTPSRAR